MKSRAFLLCSSASFPSPPGQLSRAKFKSLLKNLHTLVLPLPWRNGERQAARKSARERERERELYCGRCLVTGRPHLHALNELGLALSLSLSLSLTLSLASERSHCSSHPIPSRFGFPGDVTLIVRRRSWRQHVRCRCRTYK